MYTYIQLNDTPRVSRFPYPTEGVVIMHNFSAREHIYKYVRTEVCFRLESACEQAVDIVNGVRRTTLFPHVVYKYPGHVYQYRAEPRNAIAFFYSPEVSGELKKLDLLPEDDVCLCIFHINGGIFVGQCQGILGLMVFCHIGRRYQDNRLFQ